MAAQTCRLLYILSLACLCPNIAAYIVGGAVMHHGALTLDPRNFDGSENATDAALALHYAALDAGQFIRSLEAEIVVLVTPHGLALPQTYVLYNNPSAEGSVSVDAWLHCSFQPCVYNASAKLDVHLIRQLESALTAHGSNVMTLSGFGPPSEGTLPLPLAWAEVIPLYFLERAYAEPVHNDHPASGAQRWRHRRRLSAQVHGHGTEGDGGRGGGSRQQVTSQQPAADATTGLPHLVILSMPSSRYEHSVSMIPELLALGKNLFAQLDGLDQRIAVVVSGDLAHTWDPAGPYGYSEHAARFDAAVQQWAHDLDRNALLKTAAKSVGEAKSCGFPGMVLLQGLMDGVKPDNMHSVLLEYGHPSYYGMMCAVFDFQGDA